MPAKKAGAKKAGAKKAAIKSIVKKTQKAKATSEKADQKSKVKEKITSAKKATDEGGKKGKKAKDVAKGPKKPKHKKQMKPLREGLKIFTPRKKNFGIGRDVRPKQDLRRFVRWPKYILRQRQKQILMRRLKVPPAINQFRFTLDGLAKKALFRLIRKYKPEKSKERKLRLRNWALLKLKNPKLPPPPKKLKVRVGLRRVTPLIERKQAKLVVIANNCNPIELVVWMPALCRKLEVPYCIVKNDAALGRLVGLNHCSCLAITDVKEKHRVALEKMVRCVKIRYVEKFDEARKKWGGLELSRRTKRKIKIRQAALLAAKGKGKK